MHWEQPVTAMAWYRRRCWNDAGLEEDELVSVSQMDKSRFAGSPKSLRDYPRPPVFI